MFEVQKHYVFTDANLTYDGSDYATVKVTPGALTGDSITFTADGAVFTASMVGRQFLELLMGVRVSRWEPSFV